jgi:glycosyltransferase involved in cell wall biosynthesis
MSNALLEYMAAGRAIVATDVGANSRLLDNGRCGLIVPPGDGGALVDALSKLIANPLRAAGYGAAARTRVDAEFSRDAMRKRFESFYRDCLS